MKKIATTISPRGSALTKLLIKAAGLEGKRVKSLSCECHKDKAITFTAELYGDDEQIGSALGVADATAVIDEFAEYVSRG